MPASPARSVAVLGGGITGLTAAFRLAQRGVRVRLFEAGPRTGGAIRSEAEAGWLFEHGPNTILGGEPALATLLADLGLDAAVVPAAPEAKHRYVVRRGRPVALPLSPPALLRSRLFSVRAKAAFLAEFLTRPRVRTADLSLQDFIRGHFNAEIVDYALNPFVTGIYAGNPAKLSTRHAFPKLLEIERTHGSLLRGQLAAARARPPGVRPGIFSFAAGLQVLPDTLAARLPVGTLVTGARLEALLPGQPWNVVWHDGTATRTEAFDRVVAALPAPALAQLRFGPHGERPLAALDAIEHPPVASLFLGYRREQVAHPLDGFGLLVPEVERRSILGVLFSSSLFPGRAPAGHVALTVLIGGTRQPALARQSPAALLATAAPDLAALLGVEGAPVFQRSEFWPRAIPQYDLGYEQHLETMAAAERALPGLLIGGQARDGISVPACLAAGEKLAARIA